MMGRMMTELRPFHRWQDWVNLILGVWLFISPWILTPVGAIDRWNFWVIGVIIAGLALYALAVPRARLPEWMLLLFGAWMFISPWTLAYSVAPAAAWNAWIAGLLVMLVALWAIFAMPRPAPELRARLREPVNP